jgi:hypothetical protein
MTAAGGLILNGILICSAESEALLSSITTVIISPHAFTASWNRYAT